MIRTTSTPSKLEQQKALLGGAVPVKATKPKAQAKPENSVPEVVSEGAPLGHNELTVRLGLLAVDAHIALEQVAKGEGDAIEGWLAYGAALNEGRSLFHPEDDKGFGQWLSSSKLEEYNGAAIHPAEQSAAMWAAANPDHFAEARAAGNARTVRGIHAKWNEINAERAAAEARAAAVVKSREMAVAIINAEFIGAGDTTEACRLRIQRRTGLPASLLKRLFYKDMRDIRAGEYLHLSAVYDEMITRRQRGENVVPMEPSIRKHRIQKS